MLLDDPTAPTTRLDPPVVMGPRFRGDDTENHSPSEPVA